MMATAGNPLKVTTGKDELKSIMKESATLEVAFDWSNATYDNKKDLKEEFGSDYDWIINDCQTKFIEGFNETAKNVKLSATATADAKYKCVLIITTVDRFFAAMRFVPRHESKMWGTFKIVTSDTNETVVEVNIDEAEDGTDMSPKECYGKTFFKLGEKLGNLK